MYLYGAHVTSWKNDHGEELLFVSSKVQFFISLLILISRSCRQECFFCQLEDAINISVITLREFGWAKPPRHEDKLLSPSGVKSPVDYSVTGSGGWGQLPVGVWLTMRIVVQYALQCATNLSEVLLCHQKKKKRVGHSFYLAAWLTVSHQRWLCIHHLNFHPSNCYTIM